MNQKNIQLQSAHFYRVIKCKVPERGGKKIHEKPKYCFSAFSDPSAGFLISSDQRPHRIRQMEVTPEQINPHILLKEYRLKWTSYVNLAELKFFNHEELRSAIKLCAIPKSIAERMVEMLQEVVDRNPEYQDRPDILTLKDAKEAIHELKHHILS